MAGGKLSPRQKMINMMYLVLTALLALNVSKEILKSFHLMEVSFNKAQANVDSKNSTLMAAFQEQAANNPKAKPYFNRAKEVTKITDDFVSYIEGIKSYLIESTEGRAEPEEGQAADALTELKQADNMEKHANYFVKELYNGKEGGRGDELQAKINGALDAMLKAIENNPNDTSGTYNIDKADIEKIRQSSDLKALDGATEKEKYISMYFEHSPLAAVITMLTKIQNDAKNTESDVLNLLVSKVGADQFKFNKLTATVVAPSSTVMVGEEYEAKILLVASNTDISPSVQLASGADLPVEDGMGVFKTRPSSQGFFDLKGVIKLETDTGVASFPFETQYQAFQGNATIAADAMNVLYIGLDNPISVSVPGFSPTDVVVSMSGGSLASKGAGKYVAKVTRGSREANISASVKMKDGSVRNMGSMKYRILPVPKPEAKFGTIESGSSSSASLSAQNFIMADMQGFVFEGVRYDVTKYTFVFVPKRGDARAIPVNGPRIGNDIKNILRRARRGDKIVVADVQAKGPDGVKNLNPIVIDISR